MAYFRKRDNGWEYRISYKDITGKYRQKSKSGFKTKKQAELEANKIEIELSKGFQPTKNKHSIRYVPINNTTIKLLDQYRLLFKTETRIFEGISNTAVNKTLKKLVGRNIHIHSLRHTYVSHLISEGIDLFAISKIVGHKDLNITLSTYAHLLEDTKNKNNEIIRELFGANLGHKLI
ncbi:TPA: site-specific integrase [Streptococcus agalactiae]|nr:site-specific integrase [Streptococcus agalactiae]